MQAGDVFTIRPGCDKTFATCQAKLDNAVNFRGFPHVPGTDQVLSYPMRRVEVAEILAAARTWLGTPWRHQGRLKDAAVDCGGLILGVGNELRLLDFDTRAYGRIPDGQQLRALRQQGFMLLFVLVGTALTWMHFAIRRMERAQLSKLETLPELPEMAELHPPAPIGRFETRRVGVRHRRRGPLTDSACGGVVA